MRLSACLLTVQNVHFCMATAMNRATEQSAYLASLCAPPMRPQHLLADADGLAPSERHTLVSLHTHHTLFNRL